MRQGYAWLGGLVATEVFPEIAAGPVANQFTLGGLWYPLHNLWKWE